MKYSIYYGLKSGDRIVESLFQTGITKHHAIYLGSDAKGQEWIAENKKFEGVRIVPAKEYFKSAGKIDRVERFDGNNKERKNVVQRAFQLAGRPYDLVQYNCEHYANEVLTGKIESRQVTVFFTVVAALLLIRLASD